MTAPDLSIPKRWIEGHLSELDFREAGVEHSIRAALSDADRVPHEQELAEIRETRHAWLEVLHRVAESPERRLRRSTGPYSDCD